MKKNLLLIVKALKQRETNQIFKTMKFAFLFLFLLIAQAQAGTVLSQNARVNLKTGQTTLKEVMKQIESQTDYLFVYSDSEVNVNKTVQVKKRDNKVADILDVLKENGITYTFSDNYISLHKPDAISAQQSRKTIKVSGKVTDSSGEAVIGANVSVKGNASVGTITDLNGYFQLSVNPNTTLQVSYVGFHPQEVKVNGKTVFNIKLTEDSKLLSEVVVTALGIKREEKALGYAVQKVKGDEFTTAKGIDIASTLTGKIAGLNIQNSTEFNENAKILLRGEAPIVIIDGIPYGNINLDDIAPDDIESIDVLKGATASALYGSRGATGAIMITTKKGAGSEGLNVNVNSNTMFFTGYLAFPETQSSYSRGTSGRYGSDYVWGDKLDIGHTATLYNPYTYQWEEQELTSKGRNNYKNLLQFSFVTNNNVSVSQKGKYGSFRASLTEIYNRGQYPNQDLNKVTFSVGGEMSWKKFKLEASAAYNKHKASNDNGSGYSASYIYDQVIWGSAEYDIREFKDYWVKGQEGEMQNWFDHGWYDNPWFKAYEVINSYDTDLMNTSLTGSYQINSWLKAMVRGGVDMSTTRNMWRNAMSANYSWDKKGFYGLSRTTNLSLNTDAMLMANKTWGKFTVDGLVGGNIYYYRSDKMKSTTAGGLSIPGYYSLNASIDPVEASSELRQKRVNSVYGKLSLSYASTYFLDITGRNDWSSTLRDNERSYFYPSVSGSVILSEIIDLPSWWNFLKLRGSWTITKADAEIYANNNVYNISKNVWSGMTSASYPSTVIGGRVKPKKTEVWETGFATNFLNNRLYVDLAYYRKAESDFIIKGGVSPTTGFSNVQTNFKETRLRSGFEITLGGTPIKTKDFSWDILTNWAHDQYTYQTIDSDYSTKKPWVKKGATWDWFAIEDWERDPEGNIVHKGAGMPIRQDFSSKVGKLSPDLVWGITNTLKYKNVTLSFTIDGRVGGISFSRTHQMLMNSGAGKDTDTQWRYDEVVNNKKTFVGPGVKIVSGSVKYDTDGNVIEDTRVFAPNDIVVSYESYIGKFHDSASRPSRQNVLDETFFKLRNLSVSYDLPKSWCEKLGMKSGSVGVTGQNLFLWAKDYKYADPDKGADSNGYENLNSPSQRYIGFNIKANF